MERKICVVTTVCKTMDWFLTDPMRYLKHHDFEVTIICDMDEEFINKNKDFASLHPVCMKRRIDFIGGLRATCKLYHIFKHGNFDIVQYTTPNAALYSSLAAFLARVPNRVYSQWGIRYVGFCGVKRRVFKFFEKLTCSLSTHIEPDSFGNLEFGRKEGLYRLEKSYVIWNGSASGVDLKKFDISQKDTWRKELRETLKISTDAFVYGFVGRLTRDKGINELLNASKEVFRKHPSAVLVIVGDDEGVDTLDKDLYAWAQGESRILFCGKRSDVEKYLSVMDVFVLPSYREGFGSVIIEAEAMGVPVLVTEIPGPTEAMIEFETGRVVPPKDWKRLAAVILEMAQDADSRMRMGVRGVAFASERFDATTFKQHVLEARKRLIDA